MNALPYVARRGQYFLGWPATAIVLFHPLLNSTLIWIGGIVNSSNSKKQRVNTFLPSSATIDFSPIPSDADAIESAVSKVVAHLPRSRRRAALGRRCVVLDERRVPP